MIDRELKSIWEEWKNKKIWIIAKQCGGRIAILHVNEKLGYLILRLPFILHIYLTLFIHNSTILFEFNYVFYLVSFFGRFIELLTLMMFTLEPANKINRISNENNQWEDAEAILPCPSQWSNSLEPLFISSASFHGWISALPNITNNKFPLK